MPGETADPPPFHTTKVSRGDLRATIAATGTLEPEEVVDIGAQVIGQIKTLGIDPSDPAKKKIVDFGSVVYEGTVLALIDDSAYKAQVDNAEATLQRAQADLAQAQAKFDQAEEEWRRAKSLLPTNAIAQSDFDSVTANYRAALAYVASQKACVRQNEVMLRLAKTNLDNTIIRSPVHGVILDRRASVGQTVVAAFNAPSLFLIAKDLRRMQVWAAVDESDIGQVRTGMPVQFTVDTYPGEVFRGRVSQIRLKATTTARRRRLHGRDRDRQLRRQAVALPDGGPAIRDRPTQRRADGSQRRALLAAAAGADAARAARRRLARGRR